MKLPEPPLTIAVALPFAKPHDASVPDAVHVIAFDPPTVAVHDVVQPDVSSVIFTVYVPAAIPVIVCVVPPLLHE